MRHIALLGFLWGAASWAGCSMSGPANEADGAAAPENRAAAIEAADPAAEAQGANQADAAIPAGGEAPAEGGVAVGGDAAADDAAGGAAMVREKARVGVGEKGRDLGEGLVSTPVKAYFQARERVVFEIQIPSNMNLYKAQHGRGPKTHDEFMDEIVKAGLIRLPELPAGHRYVYDPAKEELFVEHP